MSLDEEELKEDVAEQSELVEPADVEIVPGLRRDGFYAGAYATLLAELLAVGGVFVGNQSAVFLGVVCTAVALVSVMFAVYRDGRNRRFWNAQGRIVWGEPA